MKRTPKRPPLEPEARERRGRALLRQAAELLPPDAAVETLTALVLEGRARLASEEPGQAPNVFLTYERALADALVTTLSHAAAAGDAWLTREIRRRRR